MAYRIEKTESGQDIVIDGWETGIAPSPHKGIANIQNGNISTQTGEVTAAFSRLSQITSTGTTPVSGTLTASVGDGTTVLASNIALSQGQWINVSAATVTTTKTTETVNILAVGGGGGGGGTNTASGSGGGGGGGQVATNASLSVGVKAYTVTVGAAGAAGANTGGDGGTGGTSTVTHIAGVTVTTDITAVGGGGGAGTSTANGRNGVTGASGGGASAGTSTAGTGGASTAGNAGGNGFSAVGPDTDAGGGGGAGAVGSNGAAAQGGAGGNGTASSISGASVTYGGGGGGASTGTGGAGGTGGGGRGAGSGALANGTANTGGGGGGAFGNTATGGTGGSGVVIISYPTGNLTASGGTITTSGGNTIHTFNSSGTFTITAINTTQNLATGNYFIDYSASAGTKVKIASSYDPTGANPTTHGTSGTITFTTTAQLGKPVAKATETYGTASATNYRYYVLDSTGLVWVNDTGNSLGWVLTSPVTSYFGSQTAPSGIAILNGWLLVFAGASIFGKPTTNLGTAFTDIGDDAFTNSLYNGTTPHFAYVGHQGRCYWTDGNYIGSLFPDTSLRTGGANIQSYCSYTAITTTGTVSAVYTGSSPQVPIGATYRVPVVFFTDDFGTMPTALTAGVVYWITSFASSSGNFTVYGENATASTSTTVALSTGDTSATLSATWTGPTKVQPVTFSNNDSRNVQFTHGSTAITWSSGLSSAATSTLAYGSIAIDLQTGASGNKYFNTFYPIGTDAAAGGITPTVTFSNQRVNLPSFETAQVLVEIGNTLLIGCKGNVIYPWNQSDPTPSGLITLPEANVQSMITVNQMAYIFAGTNGNVYITDGSTASLVLNIPDYCAGVPGSPGTYIEPNYYWDDSMYLRGRVYFSLHDQTSTKAGNCGGIWSFVPTQNLYIGQDTGIALRLEAQNSYLTYNGASSILIPAQLQNMPVPLYWAGWYSDVTTPTYGIDYSNTGTLAGSPTVIETDLIPVGTYLNKATDSNIEYKLGSALDTNATVTFKYRGDATSAWTAGSTFDTESNGLSGLAKVNFQKLQWLQLQFTLTPITSTADSNSFIRFKEIRIR